MITDSYKNVIKANLAGANVTSGNYVALAPITTPANSVRYAASGIVEGALQFSTSSTGVGIKVGSGTTAATPNDHDLQSLITSGLSGTVTNVDKSVSDGGVLITYNLTLTNTSGSSITVAEIGAFRKVGQAGTSSGTTSTSQTDQNTVFMVDRSLLSSPLAIPAGAAATITYTLKTVDAEGGSGGTVTDEDNGKVVVNGELVSQTQRSITANGTYDTTTNNSVLVDVPSSGGASTLVSKTITENGTYDPSDDSADGYSEVNVNLPLLRRKSYIPYTDQTRILQELTWADYDTENHTFGAFTLFGSSYPTVDENGLLLGENTYLAYDLVNVKRDITAYVVCKRHSSLSGDRYIFGCPSTGTFGEVEEEAVPAFTVNGADVNCVTTLKNHVYNYRSDYPIYSGDDYIVLSMQIVRGESDSVAYFSRGRSSWFGEFRHDAHLRYFYLGGDGKKKSDGTTTNSDYYFLYVAIVDGIDDIVGQSSFGAGTLNEDFLYNSINELKAAPHMSLTTKTITANGTFDALNDNADGYSQVTVNVPTSGGGTVATHEIPDFIENSTKRNILFDLYADDYNEADNSWGNLQFVTDTDTFLTDSAGVMALTSQGLEIGGKYSYRYNVNNVSAATIYLIARRRQYLSPSDEALLALEHWVGEVGENGINPLRIGTRHTSGDSDEYVYFPRTNGTYVDQPIQKFNVYTLAFNGDAHRANLYVNGAFVSYMQINSDYVFTHVDIGVDCDVQVLYAGMVAGVEPSTTIIRNQQIATSFFANAQVALWDEDTLVPSFLTYSNQGDILINSSYLEYDKTNNVFGDFTTLGGTLSSDCEGIRVDDDTMLTYGLPSGTTSVTVYAIIKGVIAPNDTSTAALVQLGNSSGSGNGVILGYSNQLKAGTYPASSGSWYQPITALAVYAISVNCSTNKASFYADGVLVATVDISDSPYNTLSIGGAYLSGVANSATDVQFLYVGLVDGAESQSVIVQNCAQMISFLEDARIAVATGARTLIQKTITANGTYNPANDNARAYSSVTVNVPDSSGASFNIPDFIASSDKSKVLLDLYPDDFNDLTRAWGSLSDSTIRGNNDTPYYYYGRATKSAYGLEVPNDMCLSGQVDVESATFYCVFSVRAQRGINNVFYLELLETKDILFPGSHYETECIGLTNNFQSVYAYPSSDSSLLYSDRPFSVNEGDYNVFTISVDVPNKQAKYYCNGSLVYTVSFTPRSDDVSSIPVKISNAGACYLYLGAVEGVESQQTILANHSAIMSFLGSARVRHQTIPYQSSYFSRNSYYSFVKARAATDNAGGSGWNALGVNAGGSLSYDCTGTRLDENTALICDVSVKSSSTPSESVAYSSGFTVYAICKQVKLSKDDEYAVMLQVANIEDGSSNISLGSFDTNSGPSYDSTNHRDDISYTDTTSIFFGSSVDSTTHVDSFYNATKMGYSIYAISVSYGNTANWKQPKAYFYIDGYKQAEIELNEATYNRVVFGGSYNSSTLDTSHDFRFLYISVVSCPESDGLIYRNCCDMRSYLKDARISLPLS